MANTYVTKVNGNFVAASAIRPNSPLAETIEGIRQEVASIGAFQVVPLTSGANPVPDVSNPSTKTIYLTKEDGSAKTDPYTEWIYIEGTPAGTWEIIGETSIDLSGKKDVQSAVTDPSASGTALEFISNISQDAQGVITPTKKTVADAVASVSGAGGSSGLMSAADKEKLNGIAANAEENVQSDWSVTDASSDAYIKHKPDLSAVALSGDYDDLSNKPSIPTIETEEIED